MWIAITERIIGPFDFKNADLKETRSKLKKKQIHLDKKEKNLSEKKIQALGKGPHQNTFPPSLPELYTIKEALKYCRKGSRECN